MSSAEGLKKVLDNIRAKPCRAEVKNILDYGNEIYERLSYRVHSRAATPSPNTICISSSPSPISFSYTSSSSPAFSTSASPTNFMQESDIAPLYTITTVPIHSRAFFLLTLLDLMAVASKIGQGSEDFVDVMAGSDVVANRLLSDSEIIKFVKNFLNGIKILPDFKALKFPIDFAINFLIASDLKVKLIGCLPKKCLIQTCYDFKTAQEQNFKDCLTEASNQSRSAISKLIETSNEIYFLDDFLLNPEFATLCMQARIKCRHIIEDRINNASSRSNDHVNEARKWLRNSFALATDAERKEIAAFDASVKPKDAEVLEEKPTRASSMGV